MVIKLNPPVPNSNRRNFARWELEVDLWSEITDVAKNKTGIAVALSLPGNGPVCEQVIEGIAPDDLKQDDGMQTLGFYGKETRQR